MVNRTIWIVEGIGDDNPRKYKLKAGETVREIKKQFADKLGVNASDIEVSTNERRLTNESADLNKLIDDGDTIYIIPRAKSG